MRAIQSPKTLASIGHKLWGSRWVEPMSAALTVNVRDILQWDAKPELMPSFMEERIMTAAEMRLQEIQEAIASLNETEVEAICTDELVRASPVRQAHISTASIGTLPLELVRLHKVEPMQYGMPSHGQSE
jgi:hypothetical protein